LRRHLLAGNLARSLVKVCHLKSIGSITEKDLDSIEVTEQFKRK
jgi:hypothetical protein